MVVHVIDFSRAPPLTNSVESSKNYRPSFNPFSQLLRSYVLSQLRSALTQPNVTSIILTGGRSNFSAGADLTELMNGASAATDLSTSSSSGPSLLDVIALIDASSKPIIAAISGACLGGGMEVALACHYRICTPRATLGLPETQVGLIPGAGGTQRLPRCIGLAAALPLILTGQSLSASKAFALGLVDAVATADLMEVAHRWAAFAEVMPLEPRRLSGRPVPIHPATAHVLLHTAKLQLPRHGAACQEAALEAVRASLQPIQRGMQVELDLFVRLLTHPEGLARRHAFFAVRTAQRLVDSTVASSLDHPLLRKPKNGVPEVEVAVIGAGTMGAGIALVLLQAQYRVWLVDVSPKALQNGVEFLHKAVQSLVQRRKLSADQAKALLLPPCFQTTLQLQDLQRCHLVVEAVVENLDIKRALFKKLSGICPPTALLVSNTSTLDIDSLAHAVTVHPSRVAGWHFFSPAHVMKLVEIVSGQATSSGTTALLQTVTKQRLAGKIGVVVGNCDGFCGNRMLKPYSAETALLLVEGATIDQVDQALLDFGMALGPFQMSDLAGNDVGYNIRKERKWVRMDKNDPIPPARPARYTELVDDMVAKYGRLGQKSGKGWYDYPPESPRQGVFSRDMQDLIGQHRTSRESSELSGDEIVERVLLPLVNEGFKCLEDGIARCPSDIDVIYLYGYGFPVWRGGPMFWADHHIGLPNMLEKLRALALQFPNTEHFIPSKLLENCVSSGLKVEEFYPQCLDNNRQKSRL